jgi:DNA-binding transcriptional LysR family regulator
VDRIAAINVFVRAAQTRSFVDAGRILGVSASAVGKSVVRLEQHLGARLFHRNTRNITLTPEGMLFLKRGRRILEEFEQAGLEVRQDATAPRGLLRISLPSVDVIFGDLVASFHARRPDVQLDVEVTNRPVDVIGEGFDVVIRTGQLLDTALMTRQLARFRMLIVASPTYLSVNGTPASSDDLIRHRLLMMRMPQTGRLQPWGFDTPGDMPDGIGPAVVCNDLAMILALAAAGHGIAYVPRFAVGRHIADGMLIELLEGHVAGEEAFQALWPSGRLVSPNIREFIDFAASHLRSVVGKAT